MSQFVATGTGSTTDTGEPTSGSAAGQSEMGWDSAMPYFRQRWEQQFGPHGARWENYEPRYRYGWELAHQPDHQGKSWFDVQAVAREGWEAQGHDIGWEQASVAVRDAFEHAVTMQSDTSSR